MGTNLVDYTVLIVGTALASFAIWFRSRPSIPLPPGPKGTLILGSALEIGRSNPFWIDFARYNDQYGPIITIRMLFQRMIIISDPKIAVELFEKRAAHYSDRIVSQLATLAGWDRDIIFIEYGPTLKHYRTLLQRALNNRVVLDYLPLQEHEVKRMMRRLWETPDRFMDHIHLMAGSVAIRMVYGYKADSHDDPLVKCAERIMTIFADIMTPGRWLIEIFPLLRYLPKWLPGTTFHQAVASWGPIIDAHQEQTFDFVKQQLAAGTAEPSFVSKLLQPENGEVVGEEEQKYIKGLAASLYGAASDTTVSAIKTFFLAMTLYPETQARAQAEIAEYFQSRSTADQTPFITMSDRQHLPYTSALLRELLRWHPIVSLIAHRTCGQVDENVVVDGKTYRIPARTPTIFNAWSIFHNPEVYPDPDRFMPERFLVENPPPNPENYAFGFGRRSCPGTHVAHQSMWLSVSNVLANFNITKARDESGAEIIPEERYTTDVISHPLPFKCKIQSREGREKWLSEVEN